MTNLTDGTRCLSGNQDLLSTDSLSDLFLLLCYFYRIKGYATFLYFDKSQFLVVSEQNTSGWLVPLTEVVVQRCSVKKMFLEILQNIHRKTSVPECFPLNFAEFQRTFFLTEHLRWLLLQLVPHQVNGVPWNMSKNIFFHVFNVPNYSAVVEQMTQL